MIFSPIRMSDREAIDRIRARYHRQTSAWFAFHSLYLWQDTLGLSILLEDAFFVVRYGIMGQHCYFMPCGDPARVRAFLHELTEGGSFRIFYATEADLPMLLREFPQLRLHYDRSGSEYLFDIDALCDLSDSKYHRIRHQLHSIRNKHDVSVVPLSADNTEEAKLIVRNWFHRDRDRPETRVTDLHVTKMLFDEAEALGVRGVVVRLDGEPAGFAAGIPLSESVFDLCIRKQVTGERGFGTFLYLVLIESLRGEFRLLNAEEDMGIPGMRAKKTELKPTGLLHVWEAVYDTSDR